LSFIGIDIIEVARIDTAIQRWGDRFLKRIYTKNELELYRNDVPALAAHFAGKEAVMKALGTGTKGISWREIEILANKAGKPIIRLNGKARNKAYQLKLVDFDISLSDIKDFAIAAVIAN
jgi:holo-[acyl-carrier protein] synthase